MVEPVEGKACTKVAIVRFVDHPVVVTQSMNNAGVRINRSGSSRR